MTDLTNAPAWVQEIAERAERLPRIPWGYIRVYCGGFNDKDLSVIADVSADVPRLIEAAAGMAEALEFALEDASTCSERPCLTCFHSGCPYNVAALALAKWRGEVGE